MRDEESIFDEALRKPSAEERASFLDKACAGNAELRREVESLLSAHEGAAAFLASPPPGVTLNPEAEAFDRSVPAERAGATIGPYKLLEQIGEGGMGVVFVAEQVRPVRRKVAL